LQLSDKNDDILLDGKPVGKLETGSDGKLRIILDFELDSDRAIAALAWFAHSLEETRSPADFELVTPIKGMIFKGGQHLLLEYTLKHAGHKWRFHKNDADDWPSIIHGHDYEANLKLNPFDGKFFDTTTREYQGRLTKRQLRTVQRGLLRSKDFEERFKKLLAEAH